MHVRKATLADVPAIVRMSACFYETTSYGMASADGIAFSSDEP